MRAATFELATRLGRALLDRRWTVATAESCTGGRIAGAITDVAGSSAWFERGFVTYSNEAKVEMLGVSAATIAVYGAVSEATAGEMAAGAVAHSRADIAVAVTGVAGPDGGTADKPIGLVYVACCGPRRTKVVRGLYPGDRASVRDYSVSAALHLLRRELAG